MSNEDYKQGFLEGWKEGYKQGKLDGVLQNPPNFPPWNPNQPIFNTPKCQVCGLEFTGPTGYACANPNCPSKVWYGTQTITNHTGPVASSSYEHKAVDTKEQATPTDAQYIMRPGGRPTAIHDPGDDDKDCKKWDSYGGPYDRH